GAFTPDQCTDTENKSSTAGLGRLIVDGAAYFMQSTSDYKLFLKHIERSEFYGVNYPELLDIMDAVIQNMEWANAAYYELWQASKTLDYNKTVLEALSRFDYRGYGLKNNLNPSIFLRVEEFLKGGDVRGAYQKLYNDTGKILEKLKELKTSVQLSMIPQISKCWRLNQMYLELDLFGQYTAEVFIEMK
ncbi:MAG: hypothetical protein GY950_01615, partial [bacterium]|nr:hypothetical protein [bacterium]